MRKVIQGMFGVYHNVWSFRDNLLIADLIKETNSDNLNYYDSSNDRMNIRMDMLNFFTDFKKAFNEAKKNS